MMAPPEVNAASPLVERPVSSARPADNRARRDLAQIYAQRFPLREAEQRIAIWHEIATFLQQWVPPGGVVLEIGCGSGEFVRNITAREKWAVDLRDVADDLPPDVHFQRADGLALLGRLPAGSFDVVFMSNYLEHLSSSESVTEQLRVAHDLLAPRGRIIVLQPNIRLVGAHYWDFIDHHVALTEHSLVEAAGIAGFTRLALIVRFLPYTTRSRLPRHPLLVRAYLAVRPAWWLLGKQTLYVGERG
jgi:SAM-dependent methyltransferase